MIDQRCVDCSFQWQHESLTSCPFCHDGKPIDEDWVAIPYECRICQGEEDVMTHPERMNIKDIDCPKCSGKGTMEVKCQES